MSFHVPLAKLAQGLEKAQVNYCVLHGWQLLAETIDSDIDIVVAPEHLNRFEQVLNRELGGRIVQLLQYETSGFYFVVARLDEAIRFTAADACTDYHRHGLLYCSGKELLRDRRRWNNLWVASPRAEYLYLLTKKICKGVVPPYQRARLEQLQEILGADAVEAAKTVLGPYWGKRTVRWIDMGAWLLLENYLPQLRRSLRMIQIRNDPKKWIQNWIPEVSRRYHRWRYPTGMFVAILGPDGAGKTLLVENLKRCLGPAFRRTVAFHLRPNLYRSLAASGPVTDPHGQLQRSYLSSVMKLFYYLFDYVAGYLIKIRPALVRSSLVLSDRYYHDLFVDTQRYRYGGPRKLVRGISRFIPKPDLFLIIDVPEKQLLARKQELTVEELQQQRKSYRCLSNDDFLNAVVIDGNMSPECVTRRASEVCLDFMASRYRKRRGISLPNQPPEDLAWISSLLVHGDDARFAETPPHASNVTPDPQMAFSWLKLSGGRSYLIPCGSHQSTVSALQLYNAQTWKARLGGFLLTTKTGWTLAKCFAPKVRLIYPEKEDNEVPSGVFLDHLRTLFSSKNLNFAISLGTPGPQRKPVVQIATGGGSILGYAKVGWNKLTNDLVEVEIDICRRLADYGPNSFQVPSVIHCGKWQQQSFCVQSAPDGYIVPASRKIDDDYLCVLAEMSTIGYFHAPFVDSLFWKRLKERIRFIRNQYQHDILGQLTSAVEQSIGKEPISFHLSHGDFAPWNSRIVNQRLFLFDWEQAEWSAPAGRDFFHFATQCRLLLERSTAEQTSQELIHGALRQYLERYLDTLGLSPRFIVPLWLIYLTERLASVPWDETVGANHVQHLVALANLGMAEAVACQ